MIGVSSGDLNALQLEHYLATNFYSKACVNSWFSCRLSFSFHIYRNICTKFGTRQCGTEAYMWSKSTFNQIQGGGQRPY